MESLIFSVNAVSPIVIMVAVGYLIKRLGFLNEGVAKAINKIVFRLLLPCMLFLNVYNIQDTASIDLTYIFFALAATLLIFLAILPASKIASKDNRLRGAIIQASFRSNYALIGIPLATSLYGEEGGTIATLLSAFVIPVFNILAVLCLTVYGEGKEKPDGKKILCSIAKNPLILSILLGFLCLGIRAVFEHFHIGFRLSDIAPLYSVLNQFSKTATPLALLVLGAQFEFSVVTALKKQIIFGTVIRTVIVPAVALFSAYLMGCFGGAHFAAFVALFASPVAVSSVPMAQELGSDTRLAGQLVVWTTIVSAFTIFLFSFLLKAAGIFS